MLNQLENENHQHKDILSGFSSFLCNVVANTVEKQDEYFAIYTSGNVDEDGYNFLDELYYITYKNQDDFEQAITNADNLTMASQINGELLVDCIDILHKQKADMQKHTNRVRAKLLDNYYNAQIDLLESELDLRYLPQHLKDRLEEIPFTPDEQTIKKYIEIENGEVDISDIEYEL